MEVPESGASRCLSAIVHQDSGAMLHLISVSAPCLTCTDELSSGTRARTHRRRRLGRSPAPPPLGSQMTVFRLDCRANEVEQLHVPSDACSSLPPTATPGTLTKSIMPFPITGSQIQDAYVILFSKLCYTGGSMNNHFSRTVKIGTLWDPIPIGDEG